LGEADDAVGADAVHRPFHHRDGVGVVQFRDLMALVDEERKWKIKLFAEGRVLLGALAIDAEDRRAIGCPGLTELAELFGSARRVVGGIKHQDDVAASQRRERDGIAAVVGQREVGGRRADRERVRK